MNPQHPPPLPNPSEPHFSPNHLLSSIHHHFPPPPCAPISLPMDLRLCMDSRKKYMQCEVCSVLFTWSHRAVLDGMLYAVLCSAVQCRPLPSTDRSIAHTIHLPIRPSSSRWVNESYLLTYLTTRPQSKMYHHILPSMCVYVCMYVYVCLLLCWEVSLRTSVEGEDSSGRW